MGNRVNPEHFRIGITTTWDYYIRDPLLANIFIYRLVKNILYKYGAPYIRPGLGRKFEVISESGEVSQLLPVKDLKNPFRTMRRNLFLHRDIVFSHLYLGVTDSVDISIFYFDSGMEQYLIKNNISQKTVHYQAFEWKFLEEKVHRKAFFNYFIKNYFVPTWYLNLRERRAHKLRYDQLDKKRFYKNLHERFFSSYYFGYLNNYLFMRNKKVYPGTQWNWKYVKQKDGKTKHGKKKVIRAYWEKSTANYPPYFKFIKKTFKYSKYILDANERIIEIVRWKRVKKVDIPEHERTGIFEKYGEYRPGQRELANNSIFHDRKKLDFFGWGIFQIKKQKKRLARKHRVFKYGWYKLGILMRHMSRKRKHHTQISFGLLYNIVMTYMGTDSIFKPYFIAVIRFLRKYYEADKISNSHLDFLKADDYINSSKKLQSRIVSGYIAKDMQKAYVIFRTLLKTKKLKTNLFKLFLRWFVFIKFIKRFILRMKKRRGRGELLNSFYDKQIYINVRQNFKRVLLNKSLRRICLRLFNNSFVHNYASKYKRSHSRVLIRRPFNKRAVMFESRDIPSVPRTRKLAKIRRKLQLYLAPVAKYKKPTKKQKKRNIKAKVKKYILSYLRYGYIMRVVANGFYSVKNRMRINRIVRRRLRKAKYNNKDMMSDAQWKAKLLKRKKAYRKFIEEISVKYRNNKAKAELKITRFLDFMKFFNFMKSRKFYKFKKAFKPIESKQRIQDTTIVRKRLKKFKGWIFKSISRNARLNVKTRQKFKVKMSMRTNEPVYKRKHIEQLSKQIAKESWSSNRPEMSDNKNKKSLYSNSEYLDIGKGDYERYIYKRVFPYKEKMLRYYYRIGHPLWLMNLEKYFPFYLNKSLNYDILHGIKILKFLLRYLKFANRKTAKQRIYFFNILLLCCVSLLRLLPRTRLFRRLVLFTILTYIYLYSFKYQFFIYNKILINKRFRMLYPISKVIAFSLQKVAFLNVINSSNIKFYAMNNRHVNAQFIANYMYLKLARYFTINEILGPIMSRLKRLNYIDGFRFVVSGRLTRKQRAWFIVKHYNRMPQVTVTAPIEYASGFRMMRFGMVGFKVFLLYIPNFIGREYFYMFEFKNRLNDASPSKFIGKAINKATFMDVSTSSVESLKE